LTTYTGTVKTLVHTPVSSRLDYCNGVLIGGLYDVCDVQFVHYTLVTTGTTNKSHAIAGTTARCAVNFEAWLGLCNGTGALFDEHTRRRPLQI